MDYYIVSTKVCIIRKCTACNYHTKRIFFSCFFSLSITDWHPYMQEQ